MSKNEPLSTPLTKERKRLIYIEMTLLASLTLVAIGTAIKMSHDAKSRPVQKIKSIPNLITAVDLETSTLSESVTLQPQATALFPSDQWVTTTQVLVPTKAVGDFVDLKLKDLSLGRKRLEIYFTKSFDYGVVNVYFNDQQVCESVDLFSFQVIPYGPIDCGLVDIKDSDAVLRIRVVGKNSNSRAPYYQFGMQGLTLVAD